jgi:hypothetical protein
VLARGNNRRIKRGSPGNPIAAERGKNTRSSIKLDLGTPGWPSHQIIDTTPQLLAILDFGVHQPRHGSAKDEMREGRRGLGDSTLCLLSEHCCCSIRRESLEAGLPAPSSTYLSVTPQEKMGSLTLEDAPSHAVDPSASLTDLSVLLSPPENEHVRTHACHDPLTSSGWATRPSTTDPLRRPHPHLTCFMFKS